VPAPGGKRLAFICLYGKLLAILLQIAPAIRVILKYPRNPDAFGIAGDPCEG
jgi:hypothetical protein